MVVDKNDRCRMMDDRRCEYLTRMDDGSRQAADRYDMPTNDMIFGIEQHDAEMFLLIQCQMLHCIDSGILWPMDGVRLVLLLQPPLGKLPDSKNGKPLSLADAIKDYQTSPAGFP